MTSSSQSCRNPNTARKLQDERSEAAILCPKSMEVTRALQEMMAAPDCPFSIDVKVTMQELANELHAIQTLQEDVGKAKWPQYVNSLQDQHLWERILQRARLAVYEATVTLVCARMNEDKCDTGVLISLTKALASGQISSGSDWKSLRPPRRIRNTPNPMEVDERARLVAAAAFCKGKADRRALYVAATQIGWEVAKAKRVVHDSSAGKLNDPSFLYLSSQWHQYFKAMQDAAAQSGQTLSITDLVLDPYSS